MKTEERTEQLLIDFSISSAPVNVEEIAKKFNIFISQAPSKEFSGLLYRKEDVAFMAINSSEPLVRQRFTIAHELGHYFLHISKDTFIEYRDNDRNAIKGPKEIEANEFAAALLMPRKFIEKEIKNFENKVIDSEKIIYLAKKFHVSEEAMNFRLINLNIAR